MDLALQQGGPKSPTGGIVRLTIYLFTTLLKMFMKHHSLGGTICYISFNIRDRFLGRLVLDAFFHKKTENTFENFEN